MLSSLLLFRGDNKEEEKGLQGLGILLFRGKLGLVMLVEGMRILVELALLEEEKGIQGF